MSAMFCYQCQEAAKGEGCSTRGTCGKTPELAALLDLLVFVSKGVSLVACALRKHGHLTREADAYVVDSLFMSITNANWDEPRTLAQIRRGIALRDAMIVQVSAAGDLPSPLPLAVTFRATDEASLKAIAPAIGVLSTADEDIRSLRELLTYGLKGAAAYLAHASNLGHENDEVVGFLHEALAATTDDALGLQDLLALVMECGRHGVTAMALLDGANTGAYGNPAVSSVDIGVRKNPAILVSGHDLRDLHELLEQSAGSGVDIYTHGEMLPAHYYPAFKKYPHLAGNYGNAWWQQDQEFESFNGAILLTTNCLVPPRASYSDRLYTTGHVGYEGCPHIPERTASSQAKDFSAIIAHAQNLAAPTEIETGSITGGFAHHQVMELAGPILDAIKSGAIRKFVVMAGCDGRMKSRSYYTDFANQIPDDTVILTAGCAKFRYNKLPLSDINGIPRVLDAGQCNDSYSLAVIALKLKEVLGLDDINDLPIAYNIAWYEQKAVIVLLALLHLGVKNIHLGPTLPAFLSPNVAKVLIETFGIGGIDTVEKDIATMIGHPGGAAETDTRLELAY
jgi:hydroxylamine reductase